jgi:Tc5 transposase DNA-binding domain
MAKLQRLTPEEEGVLVQWCMKEAAKGTPFSRNDILAKAAEISGKELKDTWLEKFLNRHPEITASKPVKLDPKRAKNFNEATVNRYFDQLKDLHASIPGGIPPEHIWNMDEKGIQMGGGRKNSGKKYYFSKTQKTKHKLKSDNLELVTVLECVSAAGGVVPPSFCLKNGKIPELSKQLSVGQVGRCAPTLPFVPESILMTIN